MLAGREETREVPHEPGQTITFRTLSGRELDEAEEVQTKRAMRMVEGMDLSAIRSAASEQTEQRESYDKDTLIRYGVVGWSYADEFTEENKQRLDAQTRAWCVSVILEMNVRPLDRGSVSEISSSTENSHRSSPSLTASTSPE